MIFLEALKKSVWEFVSTSFLTCSIRFVVVVAVIIIIIATRQETATNFSLELLSKLTLIRCPSKTTTTTTLFFSLLSYYLILSYLSLDPLVFMRAIYFAWREIHHWLLNNYNNNNNSNEKKVWLLLMSTNWGCRFKVRLVYLFICAS